MKLFSYTPIQINALYPMIPPSDDCFLHPTSETLSFIRKSVKIIFRRIKGDDDFLCSVKEKVLKSPELDEARTHLASYALDYSDVKSKLQKHLKRITNLRIEMSEKIFSTNELEVQMLEHQRQANQWQKKLEQFDLHNGFVSESQFKDPKVYENLEKKRKEIIALRDMHEEKAVKIKNSFLEDRKYYQEKLLSFEQIKIGLKREAKSILDAFMNLLEKGLKTEELAMNFIGDVNSVFQDEIDSLD